VPDAADNGVMAPDDPPSRREATTRWLADAEAYDAWFDQPWGRYAFAIERAAVLDAAGDLRGATVADIGCGTGRLTTQLEQVAGRVVGFDVDAAMVGVAARSTRALCPRWGAFTVLTVHRPRPLR
jgi:predicted RNA methylase